MTAQRLKRCVGVGLLTLAVAALPQTLRAEDILLPDFDLFDPLPGTLIYLENPLTGFAGLVPFIGAPLRLFDFGSGPVADPLCPVPAGAPTPPSGLQRTGNTDTIIRRDECIQPGHDSSPIELVAMQLVSDGKVDLGDGVRALYFLTLQTGVSSLGTMTYEDFGPNHGPPRPPHGLFSYPALDWNFDVWKGRLPEGSDTPVFSDSKTLALGSALSSGLVPWSHFGPPGSVLIEGVNYLLDGSEESDSFAILSFVLTSADGTAIIVGPATVPEPPMMALIGTTLAGLAVRAQRRQRHRA